MGWGTASLCVSWLVMEKASGQGSADLLYDVDRASVFPSDLLLFGDVDVDDGKGGGGSGGVGGGGSGGVGGGKWWRLRR